LCSLRSEWNNVKQSLNVDAKAQRGKLTVLNFQGDYFPARQGKYFPVFSPEIECRGIFQRRKAMT